MTESPLSALLPLLDNSGDEQSSAERYQQLLQALRQALACDAIALLKSQDEQWLQLAILDLRTEPLDTQEQRLPVYGLREAVDAYQRQLIETLLRHHRGNLSATARVLKIDRGNLHRLTRRLGITNPRQSDQSDGTS